MPGRAWQEGRPVWLADLYAAPSSERIEAALNHEMASGWAVPVREGNKVLAVLEFYCHFSLREDPEALASIETVAASLGQMLARSQERGRAEESTVSRRFFWTRWPTEFAASIGTDISALPIRQQRGFWACARTI